MISFTSLAKKICCVRESQCCCIVVVISNITRNRDMIIAYCVTCLPEFHALEVVQGTVLSGRESHSHRSIFITVLFVNISRSWQEPGRLWGQGIVGM